MVTFDTYVYNNNLMKLIVKISCVILVTITLIATAILAVSSCGTQKRQIVTNPITKLILQTSRSHTKAFLFQKEYEMDRFAALENLDPHLDDGDTLFYMEGFKDLDDEYDCTVYYSYAKYPVYYFIQKLFKNDRKKSRNKPFKRNLVKATYLDKKEFKPIIPFEVNSFRHNTLESEINKLPRKYNPTTNTIIIVFRQNGDYSLKYYSYMGTLKEK